MTADPPEPAIACTLRPTELGDRRAAWERLSERALRERQPIPLGVRLVFAGNDEVERELRHLARLEADCCSFADWKVTRRGEGIVLDVTAPGEAVTALRALFDVPFSRPAPRVDVG